MCGELLNELNDARFVVRDHHDAGVVVIGDNMS